MRMIKTIPKILPGIERPNPIFTTSPAIRKAKIMSTAFNINYFLRPLFFLYSSRLSPNFDSALIAFASALVPGRGAKRILKSDFMIPERLVLGVIVISSLEGEDILVSKFGLIRVKLLKRSKDKIK